MGSMDECFVPVIDLPDSPTTFFGGSLIELMNCDSPTRIKLIH